MTLLSSLFHRSERRRAFSSLMALDDRLLRDIGLTRADVHQLSSKSRSRVTRSHE